MPPKHKRSKASTPLDQRLLINGRWLGVPTTFFGVESDGGRYLAKATGPHKSKKDMVWMQFAQAGYGDKAYAPLSQLKKWMVTDEVALDPAADWYEDPVEEDEDEDEGEGEDAAAAHQPRRQGGGRGGRHSNEPRGSVKAGRWKPAEPKKTPHAVDSVVWRKASGTVPSHKPKIFPRQLPAGRKEGLQQPLPNHGPVHLELLSRQWDLGCWKMLSRYSELRISQLKIGTAGAISSKPNMSKSNPGTKGKQRRAPAMTVPFIIRLHVIVSAMAICRLPGRKYYWKNGRFIGSDGVKAIMGENAFSQGMRCLYDCDATKLVQRGDLSKPPPVGYDKMAKTRELDSQVMDNTLAAFCPPRKLSNDEASEPNTGKNGEGAAIVYNKDKPHKWATRVQTINDLQGARYVWHVLNCPRREKAEHGETYKSTLDLINKVHGHYGSGFSLASDSLYNSPVTVVDAALLYQWNLFGTAGHNRRGVVVEPDSPGDTRGACVHYFAKIAGVPVTQTFMRDNQLVRFLSTQHGVPAARDCITEARWDTANKEYVSVQHPPVKKEYDVQKVGTDLFGQHMEVLESTFKTFKPWMAHHVWLWQGCFVNVHVWRNRLIDSGERRLAGATKQTLVEDTLQTLEELLAYADKLEREASALGKRKRPPTRRDPQEPPRKSPRRRVEVSRLGSPSRHPPVTFTKRGDCMWCRKSIFTGCGHKNCGHMHQGDCWLKCHSRDEKIRAKLKKKRVQPVVAKSVEKARPPRPHAPSPALSVAGCREGGGEATEATRRKLHRISIPVEQGSLE